jgi:excisionase family DNA binding protein
MLKGAGNRNVEFAIHLRVLRLLPLHHMQQRGFFMSEHRQIRPDTLTISVDEASAVTDLSGASIRKLIVQGQLKGVRIGKRQLVDYQSLKELGTPVAA